MRDPYKILGVPRDAGADQIKAAWRSKAKSAHPDHNPDDPTATARFAEIGRAYETLKDPKKRSRFDQLARMAEAKNAARAGNQTIMQQRQAAEAAARDKVARAEKVMEELARATAQKAAAAAAAERAAEPRAAAGPSAGTVQPGVQAGAPQAAGARESAEDMVERIFGAKPNAAAETVATATATAEKRQETPRQYAEAVEQQEEVGETEAVLAAGGIGAIIGRPPLAMLSSLVRRLTGQAPSLDKAPDIAAEATLAIDDILKGNWISVTLSDGREVRFQAAPGISDGQVVRLKGQGLKLQGLQRGDVAITVHVEAESRFRVKGLDVHTVLPLTIENAVLGCTASVEGPNGEIEITVPAWSGSDHSIRIEGAGLADLGGAKGDLIVELRLMLWEKPDDKVTDLMRSMKNGLFL
ncbi:DnaJ C-terminal domain-containing protein [Rhizobium sp. RAF56]|jgi:DnaJ-class molecular chaperone|uniref:DnaJ C-terminal domain-containing protein n=1 Tax=Rhizobium sp. RAF56 TaxID=3233062 RepID=UPI003F95341B